MGYALLLMDMMNTKIKYAIAAVVVLIAVIAAALVITHNNAVSVTTSTSPSTGSIPLANPDLAFIDTPSAFFSNFSYVDLALGTPGNNTRTSHATYSISGITINSTAFFLVNYTSDIAPAPNGSLTQYNITYSILLNQKDGSIYNITYTKLNGTKAVVTGQNAVISGSFYMHPLESLVLSGAYVFNQSAITNSRGASANQTIGNIIMNVTPFNVTEQYFPSFLVTNSTPVLSRIAPYNAAIQVGMLPGGRYLVLSMILNGTGYWITSLTSR